MSSCLIPTYAKAYISKFSLQRYFDFYKKFAHKFAYRYSEVLSYSNFLFYFYFIILLK